MVEAFSNMDAPIGRHIPAKSKQNQLEKNSKLQKAQNWRNKTKFE